MSLPAQHSVDNGYGEGGAGSEFSSTAIHLALLFTIVGTCISLLSVWLHWKNYRKPNQQRQVTRILWMVPIYGISTFVSLVSLDVAFYVDTFRDIYEAFVIYAFFNLLLNKLGGERALIIMLHSRPPTENFFPGTLWSREIYVGDPYTFLFVKRGILQFVYVKPILAVLTMILKAVGKYHDGEISWSSSYLYLTFFYNLSVCLSLWCLMVFFYATKKDLVGFRPFPKFLCVKAIIFFSFWQSVIIALLASAGIIPDDGSEHISVAIQDFLICLEMVPAAIAHSFAFSYEDYYDPNVHSARMPVYGAIRDSFGLKDVFMDTLDTLRGSGFSYRSFEPSEGMPHIGSSRTSRIMAGLRYSTSTAKKHWLEPAPTSKFLTGGKGINEEIVIEASEPLEFEDPDPSDEVEEYYASSKTMIFGDYNYPVIDPRAPLWRQVRTPLGYGGVTFHRSSSPSYQRLPSMENGGGRNKSKNYKAWPANSIGQREGCIDVIVERGRGNFVVVANTDEEESDTDLPSVSTIAKKPKPPMTKPSPNSNSATAERSPLPPNAMREQAFRNHPHLPVSSPQNQPRPSHSTPQKRIPASPPSHPSSTSLDTTLFAPQSLPQSQLTSFPSPFEDTDSWQSSSHHASTPTLSVDEDQDIYLTGNVWK
ncbi:organic solute transporter Ostalpha-domain-containing protein [Radiomyces spectabilis]|uniref:organic solute transporter Ostalpha-domain-containing protein n=1 Tax=Radiomyces spectabilis TaxID=64574 RepID=UPI00221E708E|nr:organic solute transporter Ostalpha-domain-containing protein [Radiomyces spectabilis]KAI8391782.1 organic solute transporter Ostalpha-domain-containing protein [Radiomyces spectabilis]